MLCSPFFFLSARKQEISRDTSARARIFSGGFFPSLQDKSRSILTVARANLRKYMYCL